MVLRSPCPVGVGASRPLCFSAVHGIAVRYLCEITAIQGCSGFRQRTRLGVLAGQGTRPAHRPSAQGRTPALRHRPHAAAAQRAGGRPLRGCGVRSVPRFRDRGRGQGLHRSLHGQQRGAPGRPAGLGERPGPGQGTDARAVAGRSRTVRSQGSSPPQRAAQSRLQPEEPTPMPTPKADAQPALSRGPCRRRQGGCHRLRRPDGTQAVRPKDVRRCLRG